ncbi:MAG: hypothetical protein ABL952_00735 [Pyrinomonadaceae bacterium]
MPVVINRRICFWSKAPGGSSVTNARGRLDKGNNLIANPCGHANTGSNAATDTRSDGNTGF